MKNSDLRVGNYVEEEVLGNVKIIEIHSKKVVIEALVLLENKEIIKENFTVSLSDISPIEIDNDIIENWWSRREDKNDDLQFATPLDCKKQKHLVIGNYYIKCNYLHQLQNAYYSITGKELKSELSVIMPTVSFPKPNCCSLKTLFTNRKYEC